MAKKKSEDTVTNEITPEVTVPLEEGNGLTTEVEAPVETPVPTVVKTTATKFGNTVVIGKQSFAF
jgi:hypothetical protein